MESSKSTTGALIEAITDIDLGTTTTGVVEFLVSLRNITSSTVSLNYSFPCGCTTASQINSLAPMSEVEIPFKIKKNFKRDYEIKATVTARSNNIEQVLNFKFKFNYI